MLDRMLDVLSQRKAVKDPRLDFATWTSFGGAFSRHLPVLGRSS